MPKPILVRDIIPQKKRKLSKKVPVFLIILLISQFLFILILFPFKEGKAQAEGRTSWTSPCIDPTPGGNCIDDGCIATGSGCTDDFTCSAPSGWCTTRDHATSENNCATFDDRWCYCKSFGGGLYGCIKWGITSCTKTGQCSYTCDTGWLDCDLDALNGCECNTGAGYTCVDNTCTQPPTITSVSDSPDPQQGGSGITFSSVASDPDAGDTIKLYACKGSTCTNCSPSDTTNCWAVTATGVETNPSAFYTCLSCTVATNSYWAKVCDNHSACSSIITGGGGSFTCKKENSCVETVAANCFSGYAVDSYCCNTACVGACEACNLNSSQGTCTVRSVGDNVECEPGYRCDGTNTFCKIISGGAFLPPVSCQKYIDPYLEGEVSCEFESEQIIKVVFPLHSIEKILLIKIEPQDKIEIIKTKPLPERTEIIGDLVVDLGILTGTEELESFQKEIQITFTYSDIQVKEAKVDEKTLKIYFWDKNTSSWNALKSEVNTTTSTITTNALHFSFFAVIGEIMEEKPIPDMNIQEIINEISGILTKLIQLYNQLIQLLEG